jgi:hypothetical protein
MKKNMTVVFATVLFFACARTSWGNGEEFKNGNARLSGSLADGTQIQIDVRTAKLTREYPYKDAFMWGGEFQSESKVILPKTANR